VAESKRREGAPGGTGIRGARKPEPGVLEGSQQGQRVTVDQVCKYRGLGPQVNGMNSLVLPHSWKQTALIKPEQIFSSQMRKT